MGQKIYLKLKSYKGLSLRDWYRGGRGTGGSSNFMGDLDDLLFIVIGIE